MVKTTIKNYVVSYESSLKLERMLREIKIEETNFFDTFVHLYANVRATNQNFEYEEFTENNLSIVVVNIEKNEIKDTLKALAELKDRTSWVDEKMAIEEFEHKINGLRKNI